MDKRIIDGKNKYENKVFINYQGCKFKILRYISSREVIIEFVDNNAFKKNVQLIQIKKKNIRNPFVPTVCNVGYIGDMESKIGGRERKIKEYICWQAMIRRCYSEKGNRNKTYKNCTVCKEWHNFTNFYNWIIKEPNYEKWKNNERWCLDKDIIEKGNKIYSPEKCCLVPNFVNCLIINSKNARGKYPVGVIYHNNKYEVMMQQNGKRKFLGCYDLDKKNKAFETYKKAKEEYVKKIATEEYNKRNISKKCYEGLMEYKVKITD